MVSKTKVLCSNQSGPARAWNYIMAVLDIKKFKSPVLRKRCEEVGEIGEEIRQLIKDMAETMKKNQGIGLAANQVGALKRVIVLGLLEQNSLPSFKQKDFLGLVNPKIVKKSKEKEIGEEGCLSFPGIYLDIKRAKEVEVEGLTEEGDKISFKTQGLPARVLQHEIDHIDGILFFKRLGFFPRIKFWLKHPLIY